MTLEATKLADLAVPLSTSWLLGLCMGAKGKQDLLVRQKPEVLKALREQAIVQSVGLQAEGAQFPSCWTSGLR